MGRRSSGGAAVGSSTYGSGSTSGALSNDSSGNDGTRIVSPEAGANPDASSENGSSGMKCTPDSSAGGGAGGAVGASGVQAGRVCGGSQTGLTTGLGAAHTVAEGEGSGSAGAAIGAGGGAAAAGAGAAADDWRDSTWRRRSLTFAISACGSNGLARNPSQPTRDARSWSNGSNAPVSSSTGMCDKAPFFFTKSQTS
jgi:hypothetical protein